MSLQQNHFPQEVQEYFKNFYTKITSKVTTKTFHTDTFSFKKGVTQGDPISAIIFISAFQRDVDLPKLFPT
jgi:S-methylmethionine-dependent homocysteine/selenocysteine methylase